MCQPLLWKLAKLWDPQLKTLTIKATLKKQCFPCFFHFLSLSLSLSLDKILPMKWLITLKVQSLSQENCLTPLMTPPPSIAQEVSLHSPPLLCPPTLHQGLVDPATIPLLMISTTSTRTSESNQFRFRESQEVDHLARKTGPNHPL